MFISQEISFVTAPERCLPGDAASENFSSHKENIMKEKQVPEEQVRFLLDRLTGNQAFARCRGKFPDKLGVLGTILNESKSPSDFCRKWDQFSSDARIFGNLLACFTRDGWNSASEELQRALADNTYLIPGEIIPVHETEPITIVIFDFPKTLTLIRWIRCAHWMDLNFYLDEIGDAGEILPDNPENSKIDRIGHTLTKRLFRAFPNLLQHSRERRRRGDYEGWDLVQSYREHVLENFDHSQLEKIGRPLSLAINTYNTHLELYESVGRLARLGYICRTDQAQVLSRFSRKQQKKIATWSMRLPRVIAKNNFDSLFIGFHPEKVHTEWVESTYPTSPRCSNGYGVVVMAHPYAHPLEDHTRKHHEGVSISGVSLKNPNDMLAFELNARL